MIKLLMGVCLTICSAPAFAQKNSSENALMIKDFDRVISFAKKPNVSYSTETRLVSEPILQKEDTLSTTGKFYKLGSHMYFTDNRQETFVSDTLMVRVNNQRKQIWISKIDTTINSGVDFLFLNSSSITKKLLTDYDITESTAENNLTTIELSKKSDNNGETKTVIRLVFDKQTWLPKSVTLVVDMKMSVDDEEINNLKNEGLYKNSLIKTINGQKYLLRSQTMTVLFNKIDTTQKKALSIPSLGDRVELDSKNGHFKPAGVYSDYDVVKTF